MYVYTCKGVLRCACIYIYLSISIDRYIHSYRMKSHLNTSTLSLQSTTSLLNMMISFHIPMNFMGVSMKEMMSLDI